nr:MFS transporter [Mycobacterium sp. E796]
MAVEPTTPRQTAGYSQTGLPRRRFVAMLGALGGIQLLAMMDGTVAIFALPKIQNELGLSDATRNWVITAYVLTSGGLILLGGRVGDTFGHKRTLIVGTALFTLTSAMCGIAWDGGVLVSARLLKGVAAAIVSPTAMALLATTFPKGPARNTAMAVFGAMASIGAVVGMVAGGLLAEVSWRMAFLVNVPIGVLAIYLTRTALRETGTARMKLDAAGAVLATLACTAAVFAFSRGPEHGWLSPITLGSGLVAVAASVAFVLVERNAENPIVPFSLFSDRDRTATFLTTFLAGGMTFTMAVLIALYVQNIMGYGPMRAAISFIPFSIATAIAVSASVRLVTWLPPRMMVIAGGVLLLGAMLYGSTLHRGIPYFPNLVAPIFVAGIGLGMINVAIGLALIASVGPEHIGPASAISMVLRSLGGPLMLAVIQGVITSRTLRLGGTQGPVKSMNDTQLRALDHGYAYGYLWLSGAVILIGGAALLIRYTAQQVAHAQEVNVAINAGEP